MDPTSPPYDHQCSYSELIQKTHNLKEALTFSGGCIKMAYRMATMRDTQEIKQHVNQLIQEQTKQLENLVHVISVLNVTRYTTQLNRQKLNDIIDAVQR